MRERVLILGAGPLAGKLVEEIEAQPHLQLLGLLDDAPSPATPGQHPRILGRIEDLERIILLSRRRPDRVIVALTARRGRLPLASLLEARIHGIVVEDGVDAYERLTGKIAIEALTPSAVIFSKDFRKSWVTLLAARLLSVAAASVGLILLGPFLLLVALAIVIDSPGPVFFVHDRIGAYGRRLRLLKFRTMLPTMAAPSEWERDNGHRITRVGRWLRRFRIDELPQFINVLRGDMNLVGPRPHPVSNYQLFDDKIPYYCLRSAVRPGITGWAQVRYRYANDLEEETEKMRYDLYYIKHMSPWLDLRILFETVRAVLLGHRQPPARRPATAAHQTGRLKIAASTS